MEFLSCTKDAEQWDAIGFTDPHFTSAYYRAWKREGTLAVKSGCARPFLFQNDDILGNAYNYGGTVYFSASGNLDIFENELSRPLVSPSCNATD